MPSDTGTRWLDAGQQQDWRALVVATTLLFDQLDDDLRREFGLSLTEYEILVRLSESEDRTLRMAAIADALRHSRSRVTHTVARMEAAGWLRRERCSDDGRGIQAVMTEAGRDLLVRAAPVHVEGVRRNLVDLCDPEDFRAMGRVMNAAADHMVGNWPEIDIR